MRERKHNGDGEKKKKNKKCTTHAQVNSSALLNCNEDARDRTLSACVLNMYVPV